MTFVLFYSATSAAVDKMHWDGFWEWQWDSKSSRMLVYFGFIYSSRAIRRKRSIFSWLTHKTSIIISSAKPTAIRGLWSDWMRANTNSFYTAAGATGLELVKQTHDGHTKKKISEKRSLKKRSLIQRQQRSSDSRRNCQCGCAVIRHNMRTWCIFTTRGERRSLKMPRL